LSCRREPWRRPSTALMQTWCARIAVWNTLSVCRWQRRSRRAGGPCVPLARIAAKRPKLGRRRRFYRATESWSILLWKYNTNTASGGKPEVRKNAVGGNEQRDMSEVEARATAPKPKLRWYQFSVRSLSLFSFGVAVLLSLVTCRCRRIVLAQQGTRGVAWFREGAADRGTC